MRNSERSPRGRVAILLLVLFWTTCSSLVYQLVWGRKLSHVFGTSALAECTVLAIFMAGLALGSLYGGALLARAKKPSRFLAMLELAIGASCLLALLAFSLIERYYQQLLSLAGGSASYPFVILLFIAASAVLIVPTFLVGVAFPAIVELVHRERARVGRTVGSCYMVDTIGGAAGMILAAFFLIPRIGFLSVSVGASLVNVALGLLVLIGFRDTGRVANVPAAVEPPASLSGNRALILFLFFWSGFAALFFEVLWIRHVSLIYGGSLHSFAIVVVSFLLGLGLGSWCYNLFLKQVVDKVRLFVLTMLLIGLSGILVTAFLPRLETLFLTVYHSVDSYSQLVLSLAALCVGVLLLPTLLMGATLPVLSSLYAAPATIGKDVGRLFAVNSFGALLGSFIAGFFIIPWLGIEHSAFVAGGIYIAVALIFLFKFATSRKTLRATFALALLLCGLAIPAYLGLHKRDHLYNGVFYLATIYDEYFDYAENQTDALNSLLFLKHSPYGQIAVFGEDKDSIVITNNGKIDASSDPAGMGPRHMLAHIPILLHEDARDVLAIGLGGGWTLAAILRHEVDSADVVEINPAVVEANRTVLSDYNGNALAQPRVGVIVSDGRNYLANTSKRYDVVISEPPEIWVGGVSSLFTREFYLNVRRALREDGLLCQWMPEYDMSPTDYRMALNTIKQVFPFVYEFDMQRITGLDDFREYVVIGSQRELNIEERVGSLRFQLALADDANRDYMLEMLDEIQRTASRSNAEIDRFIVGMDQINTDDLPILEFHTLRNRFRKFRER
jgi:spermidine synthase